jgi:molybdopterin converting factor small subunit
MFIEVILPGLLADSVGGQRRFLLEADTLGEAMRKLSSNFPNLRAHLYADAGQIRKHVLIYYNDQSIAWLQSLDVPLKEGDRLSVIQAVSGG